MTHANCLPLLLFLGIGDFKLQLSAEPVLGKWKITAKVNGKTSTQTFKIEEFGRCDCFKETKTLKNAVYLVRCFALILVGHILNPQISHQNNDFLLESDFWDYIREVTVQNNPGSPPFDKQKVQ